jgi:filamentous hemagglutinin family protein
MALLGQCAIVGGALAAPTGGTVSGGSATITQSGAVTDITQSTSRAIIDWRSFNIAAGETVKFIQPSSSSVVLNRIGGAAPSNIYGVLTANGTVILVNPDGIFFGPGSRVDVGGLIATTANISNSDFMAGRMNFSQPGNPSAAVINDGVITAESAGLVGLAAPTVINNGTINARLGRVALASGDTFTIDMYGDNLIGVGLSSDAVTHQLIAQKGTINAAGGSIRLTAAAGRNLVDNLITVSGELKAPTAQQKNGAIVISGGPAKVAISGKLDVSGAQAGQTGGSVTVTGNTVSLETGASIDATGEAGGGTVSLGGSVHGQGPLPQSQDLSVASGTDINVSALGSGNGGHVSLWSTNNTVFNGTIEARGGAQGGNGGFVETSSAGVLSVDGMVTTTAPLGTAGQWLLDPASLQIIGGSTDTNISGNPNFTPDGTVATSFLSVGTLDAALGAGNVTVTTGGDAQANAGDISVNAAISASGGGSLTLSSYHDILLNAGITLLGGNLTLHSDNAGNGAGTIVITQNITTNGGAITMGGGAGAISAGNGFATGDATQAAGIIDSAATIDAGGGNIILNGQGSGAITDGNYGVAVINGGTITTGGGGHVSIDGQGGGSNASALNFGIFLTNNSAIRETGGGSMDVTAVGGNGAGGPNPGMFIGAGSTLATTGVGSINVTTSLLDLNGPGNLSSGGNLSIDPSNFNTNMGIGNVVATWELPDAQLADMSWGAGKTLTLGGFNAGNIEINSATVFPHPVDFVTGAGNITLDQTLTSSAGAGVNLLLDAGGNFINNAGAAALNPGGGNWQVYSTNPALNTSGGLVGAFNIYSCQFGGACPTVPGGENGFLYSFTPLLTITPLPQTVTYGGAAPSLTPYPYTVSGYLGNDAVTDSLTGSLNGTTNFVAGASAGTHFDINYASGTLASAIGYGIAAYANLPGGLTVIQAPLTITANTVSKPYGAAFNFHGIEYTDSGLVNGDTVTSVTITSPGSAPTANVGVYATIPSAAVGTNLSNYAITYVSGQLTVTPAPLQITANDISKSFGVTYNFLGTEFSVVGLLNSDSVSRVTLTSPGAAGTALPGLYAITPSAAVGPGVGNYTITYNTGLMTVNAALLTITADSFLKFSNRSLTFNGTEYRETGLAPFDRITGLTITSAGAPSTAAPGLYPVIASGVVLADAGNYIITYVNGVIDVLPPINIPGNTFDAIDNPLRLGCVLCGQNPAAAPVPARALSDTRVDAPAKTPFTPAFSPDAFSVGIDPVLAKALDLHDDRALGIYISRP